MHPMQPCRIGSDERPLMPALRAISAGTMRCCAINWPISTYCAECCGTDERHVARPSPKPVSNQPDQRRVQATHLNDTSLHLRGAVSCCTAAIEAGESDRSRSCILQYQRGVGKTAIAVTSPTLFFTGGHRTLLWDLDEQGGASTIWVTRR